MSSVLFWGLDGYYLWIERKYVDLYKKVAATPPSAVDFSMVPDNPKPFGRWLWTCRRPHLCVFYGAIVAGEVIGLLVIKGK